MTAISDTKTIDIEKNPLAALTRRRSFHTARFILRRVLGIALTIFAGVFITVVIANQGGMLDAAIRRQISQQVMIYTYSNQVPHDISPEEFYTRLETQSGLSLPFVPKHLLYTVRSLRLDWGEVMDRRKFNTWIEAGTTLVNSTISREIILARLPATLLLSGTAFLLLGLIGIPVALFLSQHEGHWADRLVGVLTPLSSVPSWVLGILLVMAFAVQVRWFPMAKMTTSIPPPKGLAAVIEIAHHMVLPVAAIVISLIFQLLYSWRTYLLVYADEDYLILARAKGLRKRAIDFHYVLRPALPYIATSIAITLVGFWQMTAALEFFFQWPGIGKLFVDSMPNFHSEVMYPGEMSIVLGLVVIFAYLLGFTVLALDFLYLIFDPRIRVETQDRAVYVTQSGRQLARETMRPLAALKTFAGILRDAAIGLAALPSALGKGFWGGIRQLSRMPSGAAGLALIGLLLVISAVVLVKIPYDPVAREWGGGGFRVDPTVAKLGQPKWVNWFRAEDLPGTILLDAPERKTRVSPANGSSKVQAEFTFDYPYRVFPSELALYIDASYAEKAPFVDVTWITPDGREIRMRGGEITRDFTYDFRENVPVKRLTRTNANLKTWVVTSGSGMTPQHYLLFANPEIDVPEVIPGTYRVQIEGTLFEETADLDARMVVFGLVEGWAGTDYLRRDLSIPLLWGLPFALLIGVTGAVVTSLLAMILAAASAWIGGWVDYLVQRATEINLILPVMAISVLLYAFYQFSIWLILGIIILSTVLGSSVKTFRAAFIQEKALGYIEAAKAYGASDWRIITHYLVRRIVPVMIPQMIMLIPTFIFLEATLAIFNIYDARYPTWGRMIFSALRYGGLYGSRFWVLEPIALMLITGLAFVLLNFSLNRILTPHLQGK